MIEDFLKSLSITSTILYWENLHIYKTIPWQSKIYKSRIVIDKFFDIYP